LTTDHADPATTADDVAGLSFDAAFRQAIEELEAGGLALEETIRRTERAVALQQHCERLLSEAELRVKQLVARPGGGLETRDLAAAEDAEG
jgi:exodeoxyribonuclease VII small subunit